MSGLEDALAANGLRLAVTELCDRLEVSNDNRLSVRHGLSLFRAWCKIDSQPSARIADVTVDPWTLIEQRIAWFRHTDWVTVPIGDRSSGWITVRSSEGIVVLRRALAYMGREPVLIQGSNACAVMDAETEFHVFDSASTGTP